MSRPSFAAALEEDPVGLRLHLSVTPRAPTSIFPGRFDPWRKRIGIRVRAPARDGQANREVVQLLARYFCRDEGDVRIAQGETASQKTVLIHGLSLQEAQDRLMGNLQ